MTTNGYSLQAVGQHRKGDHRNRWRVKISLGLDPATGKYRQRSKTIRAASERQAHGKAREWSSEASEAAGTIGAALDAWLDDRAGKIRPDTVAGYRSKVENHVRPFLGARSLADLEGKQGKTTLSAWQAQISPDLSPSSINHCIRIVRAFVRWCVKKGRLETDACLYALEAVPGSRKVAAPELDDVLRLLSSTKTAEHDLWTVLLIATTAGPRRSELAGLNVGDVHLEHVDGVLVGTLGVERSLDSRGNLNDPKTATSKRVVPLAPVTAAAVAAHLEYMLQQERELFGIDLRELDAARPLFPHPATWERHTVHQMSNRFDAAMSRAGIPKGWGGGRGALHALRRTFTTQVRDQGVDPMVPQAILGHSTPTMTDRYTTVLGPAERRAVELVEARLA